MKHKNYDVIVAWMIKTLDGRSLMLYGEEQPPKFKEDVQYIPLYTHPVKEQDCYGDGNVYRGVRSKDSEVQTIYFNSVKELTDEEILEVWKENEKVYPMDRSRLLDRTRACIRKAQNK